MSFWQVLPVALALIMIIEGMLLFVSPKAWRNMIVTLGQLADRHIRNIGLGSMLLGLVLLYWVN